MTIHPLLRIRLEPLARRRHYFQLGWKLAVAWAAAALVAVAILGLQKSLGWASPLTLPLISLLSLGLGVRVLFSSRDPAPDWRRVAKEVEAAYPELQGRLLTAVQQERATRGDFNYLQQRVIDEALAHSRNSNWAAIFPRSRVAVAQAAHVFTLAILALVLWHLRVPAEHGILVTTDALGVSVTPGDAELERGGSLVVSARFQGPPPPRVELVYGPSVSTNNRVELVRSLADPIFGGSVPEVGNDIVYHLDYGGKRTRDYKITVFDHPRLERADADISFPPYTGLPPKHLENTRRLSAVEGSRLQLKLQLNKMVAHASLVSKDTNRNTVLLAVETNRPSATLDAFLLETSKTYELRLIDADGRTNKLPAQFVFEALKNRLPELKMASPRGDTRPSPLEEMSFEGTVYDDFGVQAFGLAAAVGGQDTRMIELGRNVLGKEKRSFHFLLRLEELGLQPDDLMSWFVWSDDIGPDGKVRRTSGDLFFAEVRPFEEIFREGQSMSAEAQQQQQQSGEAGSQAGKLAELQKQIISATWKLFRQNGQSLPPEAPRPEAAGDSKPPAPSPRSSGVDRGSTGPVAGLFAQPAADDPTSTPAPPRRSAQRQSRPGKPPELANDLEVVRSAQEQALEQAEAEKEGQPNPRTADLWEAATKQMERALEKLRQATNSPALFQEALAAEQAAYQALLKLQEREYSVSRSQSRQSGQNSRQQQMQRQLDQLDLSREENRYETERQAQPPQSAERSEQLQVMNRLQELARRQQDVNERLKEMQTALQEARTEKEREEIRRQLKRLQEEQQELLADSDEVRQRMDRPENQSRMTDQRQQMEQARNELQKAAEAAQQGQTSQALASGTRAQRQLQQMRDDMRRQNAGEFEEELRQMRTEARDLALRQEAIQKKTEALNDPQRRALSDADLSRQTLDELASQRGRLTNLVEQATQLSREASEAEPLMSGELYDTLRKFSQDETSTAKQFQEEFLNRRTTTRELYEQLKRTSEQSGAKSLDLTSEMLRRGLLDDAKVAQERARAGIEDLKRGVERAAQSVLGDDTQSLRLAVEELNRLAEQLQREIVGGESGRTNRPQELAQAGNPAGNGEQRQSRAQPGQADQERQDPGSPGERNENQPEGRPARARAEERRQPDGSGTPAEGASGQTSATASNPQPPGPPGETNRSGRSPGENPQRDGNRPRTAQNPGGGGGNRPAFDLDRLLEGRGGYDGAPITGEDFAPWSDRLREVEELVDTPSLRTEVARARERARQMRQDFKRTQKKPEWATVRLQVLKPLVEVRNEINEELARREPRENLVPIDRDPVPGRYSELVRRYYEQLGKDNGAAVSPPVNPKN